MAECPLTQMSTAGPKAARGGGFFARAGVLFFAGVVLAGLFLVWVGGDLRGDILRVRGGAPAAVEFPQPGTYTLFHEYWTVVDGQRVHRTPELPPTELRLVDADGRPIALAAPASDAGYRLGSRRGTPIAQAEIPAAGAYEFTAMASETVPGAPRFVYVFAQHLPRRLLWSTVGSLLIFTAFGMAALAMIGTTLKYRMLARRIAAVTSELARERGVADPAEDPDAPSLIRRANPIARRD